MLYKLIKTKDKYDTVEPVGFMDFSQLGLKEKDLENLLAENLLNVFFEENQLMPIFQERARQEEADIYALNKNGELVIFELKRAVTGSGAVHQALRYCELSADWTYNKLQSMYHKYMFNKESNLEVNLQKEHSAYFDLDTPLGKDKFNNKQLLIIVGSAANDTLVKAVDHWKRQGLAVDFLPYRVYEINNEHYFEFFSLPYDVHSNPAYIKGVIFDTCKTYYDQSVKYMCEHSRVAAFGGQKHIIYRLQKDDIVFLYNKGEGIIAAGKVISSRPKEDAGWDALYYDLKWLTNKPVVDNLKPMPVWKIKKVLGHNFFWAITIKTPYLSKEESEKLLIALNEFQNKE